MDGPLGDLYSLREAAGRGRGRGRGGQGRRGGGRGRGAGAHDRAAEEHGEPEEAEETELYHYADEVEEKEEERDDHEADDAREVVHVEDERREEEEQDDELDDIPAHLVGDIRGLPGEEGHEADDELLPGPAGPPPPSPPPASASASSSSAGAASSSLPSSSAARPAAGAAGSAEDYIDSRIIKDPKKKHRQVLDDHGKVIGELQCMGGLRYQVAAKCCCDGHVSCARLRAWRISREAPRNVERVLARWLLDGVRFPNKGAHEALPRS